MSYLFLAGCYALHRLLISLLCALLNRNLMLDFHGFASYTLYNSISVFHSMHDHSASNFHFHNVNSVLWSLPRVSLPLTFLVGLLFYHNILAWATTLFRFVSGEEAEQFELSGAEVDALVAANRRRRATVERYQTTRNAEGQQFHEHQP